MSDSDQTAAVWPDFCDIRDGECCASEMKRGIRRLKSAMTRVLIGGNHLAILIGVDHPPYTASSDEALEHYGAQRLDAYNAWCCWKTIMQLRDAIGNE